MKLFQFAQILPIVPKFEWSSFNYPSMINAVETWNFPNVSNFLQIWKKWLYITQIGSKMFVDLQNWIKLFETPPEQTKLFEITQNWIKMFHVVQTRVELLPFGQSWFSLLEITQNFPVYGNISNFTKVEWSCPSLLEFHWDCQN